MQIFVPETALAFGFNNRSTGAHISKTMMLREAKMLFAAATPQTSYEEMRGLVVEDNITLKKTLSTRKETFQRLTQLYGLRNEILLYRALRDVWDAEEAEQPLLALLCTMARDPLLRNTASLVLEKTEGESVTRQEMVDVTKAAYPGVYAATSCESVGKHTISSWRQSGHLQGRRYKLRSRAVSGAASAAYALLLGYLCDQRGAFLFETLWAKTLDTSAGNIDALAFAASQRGWLEYRRLGAVCELRFSHLMRS